MNLAVRDVWHRRGRFVLTSFGLGLLLATVMAMGGIYRGLVDDALSIVRTAAGTDLWVVQKDTNGPFAESSRLPEDVYRALEAVPGVSEANPVAYQTFQLDVEPKPVRVQLIGFRRGGLGGPPSVVAGRPITRSRYEMIVDRKSGIAIGSRIPVGRMTMTVVGQTDAVVSSSGDPAAFVTLEDAQAIQFLKANETIRNERERLPKDANGTAAPREQDTHIVNAVLVRLDPSADARAVAAHIERWNHYSVLTAAEQTDLLTRSVVERARQQLLLFRIILLIVSTVIIALIVFTMTIEKTRDIATLKIIGASDWTIGGMIVQEALALGLIGFVLGAAVINLTYEYFPRRVLIVAFDQYVLFVIVIAICLLASLLGIRRALRVDPATAMGGGA